MFCFEGYWIILDEINLASQSVLEGLNSCFDHRSEIFISELNRSFMIDATKTKIFACQNPFNQGGGRKGLPKSFLNRFSKVYIDQMTHEDLLLIISQCYSRRIEPDTLLKMIDFNDRMNQEVCVEKRWGTQGSPWEFNLRDLFRWCDLIVSENSNESRANDAGDFVYLVYANRFRTSRDRVKVFELFSQMFGYEAYMQEDQVVAFAKTHIQIGQSFLFYNKSLSMTGENNLTRSVDSNRFALTGKNLRLLESIIKCIEMNWLVILVGHSCVGKTSLIRLLASLSNRKLVEFSVNSATDTSDLLGGFEKTQYLKQDLARINDRIRHFYLRHLRPNNASYLRSYFSYLYAERKLANKLTENCMHSEKSINDSELIGEFLSLYEANLKKLVSLHSVAKSPSDIAEIDELTRKCVELRASHSSGDSNSVAGKSGQMKFEWIDSSLVRAIESGDWVLIDNANFCPPSVLDRLNPLLERNNGILQINEKGKEV